MRQLEEKVRGLEALHGKRELSLYGGGGGGGGGGGDDGDDDDNYFADKFNNAGNIYF